MKRLLFLVLCLSFAAEARGVGQQVDVLPVDCVIDVDALGNATFDFKMSMNAKQWQAWKQQYGGNPSLLRRDMGQFVSQYVVDDFDLNQDDMNRTMTMTIKAKGVSRHRGDGRYELELEKVMGNGNAQDDGRTFRFSYTEPQGPGSVMLMTTEIKLPDGAEGTSQRTDSAGRPVLAYQVDVDTGSGGTFLTVAGILLLVGGLAFLPFAFVGGTSEPVSADSTSAPAGA